MLEPGRKLKVLFLFLDEDLPSSRIRLLDLKGLILQEGIDCEFKQFPRGVLEKAELLKVLPSFDIVFIQKKLLSYIECYLLFKFSKKVVFDFDDAIYLRDSNNENFESKRRRSRFESIIGAAHVVIAGNRVLAGEARKFSDNVVVIPSPVPVNDIAVKTYSINNSKFVVGWVGGKKNLIYFDLIHSELCQLANKYDIELRIISDGKLELPGISITNIPWSIEVQNQEVAKFDVGLMPLFDNPWAQGKCGYKALQYMASAVPAICSDVGSNAEQIDHGVNGFKASSSQDFFKYIETLINNRSDLEAMGMAARKKILECCSNEIIAKKIVSILQNA